MKIPTPSWGLPTSYRPISRVFGPARYISTSPRCLVSFGFASTKDERPPRPKRTSNENEDFKPYPRQGRSNQETRRPLDTPARPSRSGHASNAGSGSSGYGMPPLFDRSSRSGSSGADGRSHRNTPREGPRVSLNPTPLNVMPDFSSLSPIRDRANKIHFVGLHHETALQAFHRPSSPNTPLIVYRDPLIHLRAIPSRTLPSPPPNPFPPALQSTLSFRATHPTVPVIQFGVVASKNNVSKLASERVRVRSRFKAAVEGVVHRSVGLRQRTRGSDLVNTEWSYLALLSREVHEASMPDLCKSVADGLIWIKRLQDKGIGSDRQRTGTSSSESGQNGYTGQRRFSKRPLSPRQERYNDGNA